MEEGRGIGWRKGGGWGGRVEEGRGRKGGG